MDLIVTDHHLPGADGVPRALAVVNPNQKGCDYPCKHICGAGVAFKVAQGLMQRRLDSKDQTKLLLSFMKVVAIATIADAVPLTGENRVFASLGLDALRRAVNPGLKALLEAAQVSANRPPTSGEVGFRIAPRINAAGRMDVARDVIELFTVKDQARAREIAAKLDKLNTDRQEEEKRILRAVEERFASDPALSRKLLHRHGWRWLASRRHRHYRDQNCRTLQPAYAGHLTRRRGSARVGPLHPRLSSAWKQWNPAAACSRAMADTLMRAVLPCLLRIFRNCVPVWISLPAPNLLSQTSNLCWIWTGNCV